VIDADGALIERRRQSCGRGGAPMRHSKLADEWSGRLECSEEAGHEI
jgi:hypothetical protein